MKDQNLESKSVDNLRKNLLTRVSRALVDNTLELYLNFLKVHADQ